MQAEGHRFDPGTLHLWVSNHLSKKVAGGHRRRNFLPEPVEGKADTLQMQRVGRATGSGGGLRAKAAQADAAWTAFSLLVLAYGGGRRGTLDPLDRAVHLPRRLHHDDRGTA